MSDTSEIARFEALAEEAICSIYDARGTDIRAALEDARYNLEQALSIALMRARDVDVGRIRKQLARVQQTWNMRFKKKPTAP